MIDLRAQAMERMKQLDSALPQELKDGPSLHTTGGAEGTPPARKSASKAARFPAERQDISAIFQWLGLDHDRVLLLLLLWFLYKDHASPRILLAVLYVML